jgi:hypothetical protein
LSDLCSLRDALFNQTKVFMRKDSPENKTSTALHQQESDLPSGLAAPAQRALVAAGVLLLEQLIKFSEEEIKQLHGIGPNTLKQLRHALNARGLSFAEGIKIKKEK